MGNEDQASWSVSWPVQDLPLVEGDRPERAAGIPSFESRGASWGVAAGNRTGVGAGVGSGPQRLLGRSRRSGLKRRGRTGSGDARVCGASGGRKALPFHYESPVSVTEGGSFIAL